MLKKYVCVIDFWKNQRKKIKIISRKRDSFIKDVELWRVKLSNSQCKNKLKSEAKNKTGTTLRIIKKNFQDVSNNKTKT